MSTDLTLIEEKTAEEHFDDEFDLSNPKSMVNLVPLYIKDEILRLQRRFLILTEKELEDILWPNGVISEDAQIFKQAFWDEFDRVIRYGESHFNATRLMGDGFAIGWVREFIKDKHRLAWLIRIPREYEIVLKDIHRLGLKQMRVIMGLPLMTDRGTPNVKLGELKFKIMQHMDTRLKGAVVQRVENTNRNMNINTSLKDIGGAAPTSMLDIEKRLALLRRESKSLESPGFVEVDLMKPLMEAVHGEVEEAAIIARDSFDSEEEAGAGA